VPSDPLHIAMFTNTYLPLVGGASISIDRFCARFREAGHKTLVVCPEYEGHDDDEEGIIRVAALKDFNHSRFSVPLPMDLPLGIVLAGFEPTIVHAHHPFFLGDTAVRAAAAFNTPLVVTHHTHREQFRANIPERLEGLLDYVEGLATGHANLCDAVIAPSTDVRDELRAAGVASRIEVIPTGVDIDEFTPGDGSRIRNRFNVPADAFVMGHVGRLAPEKNLRFLCRALVQALSEHDAAHVLIVGEGPEREAMEAIFQADGAGNRATYQ